MGGTAPCGSRNKLQMTRNSPGRKRSSRRLNSYMWLRHLDILDGRCLSHSRPIAAWCAGLGSCRPRAHLQSCPVNDSNLARFHVLFYESLQQNWVVATQICLNVFTPNLGVSWSNLTSIFFQWLETTPTRKSCSLIINLTPPKNEGKSPEEGTISIGRFVFSKQHFSGRICWFCRAYMQGSKHLPRKYLDPPNLGISNTKHQEGLLDWFQVTFYYHGNPPCFHHHLGNDFVLFAKHLKQI